MENLGNKFIDAKGNVFDDSFIKTTKVLALFYGASWSKASMKFLPKLISFYNDVNKKEKNLEIIYINNDNKEITFKEHMANLPWLAYPFKEQNRIKAYLEYKEDIEGLPCILILRPDFSVACKSGRADVEKLQPLEAIEKWVTDINTISEY
jgi:nucleoredoxin